LLLIVLCVLFLFLLLAITYAVVASKERSVARNYARLERSGDPPNVVLDQLAMILFRDTNDPHSPFRSWSLLEGIYGNVSFRGSVSGSPAVQAGGQFLQITPSGTTLNSTANYYKGCVLTMLSGQCTGLSTRIVASAGGASPSVTVMRFQADAGLYDPANGDVFLINGRPYCGMGRGYNTAANAAGGEPFNDAMDSNSHPYALLPNPFGFQGSTSYGSDPAGPGGANVDYTAPDYNNCNLAMTYFQPPVAGKAQSAIYPSFFRSDLYNYWSAQVPNLKTNAALLRQVTFRPNLVDNPAFSNVNPNYDPTNPAPSLPNQFDVDNLGGGTPDSIWIDPGLPVFTSRDGRTCKVLVAVCELDLDGRINVNAHGSALDIDANAYPTGKNGATATSNSLAALAGVSNSSVTLPIGQGYGVANINLNAVFPPADVSAIILGMSGSPTGWPGRYGGTPGQTFSQSSLVNRQLELIKLFEFPTNSSLLTPLTAFGTLPDLKDRRILGLDPRGQPINLAPGGSPTLNTYFTSEVQQGAGATTESPYAFDLARSVPQAARYVSSATIDDPFTVGELETVLRQPDVDVRSLPQRLVNMLQSLQNVPGQLNRITTVSSDLPSPNFPAPRDLRTALASVGLHQAFGITDLLNAKFKQNCPGMVGNAAEIAKLLPPELIAGLRMDINRPFGNGRDDNNNGLVDEPGGISSNKPSAPDSGTETVSASGAILNVANWNSSLNPADPLMSANLPIGVKARQLMARQLYALMMLFADQGFTNWTIEPGIAPGSPLAQQLTARRIAQWAINAVSFRDATSIMTPFEYHWDIYQSTYLGWTVNGDPGDVNNQKSTNGNIGLVWACKPPDAVLTETLAFHDKRIADTNWDTGNNKMTTDTPPDAGGATPTATKTPPGGNFDQTRIPQGSAYLEILCTRNPNLPFAPTDLYTKNAGGIYCLDLGRMSGDGINPVWRIVISKSPRAPGMTAPDVLTQATTNPDTTLFEPTTDTTVATASPVVAQSCQQMNLFNPGQNVPIERVVWLGTTPPASLTSLSPGWSAAPGAQIYYNFNKTPILVPPGSYAVVGPRATTYIGSAGTYATVQQWGKPSQQKITITPLSTTAPVAITNPSGTSTLPWPAAAGTLKTGAYVAQSVIVGADPPPATTWNNATANPGPGGIGFSVSEPLPAPPNAGGTSGYYPEPVAKNPVTLVYDAYDDLTQTTHATGATGYPDQPLEEGVGQPTYQQLPLLQDVVGPGTAANTGTYPNYKTVFLQRLADPTSGYDSLRNPYITVDWMPIDLTVFNGEDPSPNPNDHAKTINFSSRQRGGSGTINTTPAVPNYNLWAPVQLSDTLANVPPFGAAGNANFSYQLNHTLGYLNHGYGTGLATSAYGAGLPQYTGDPPQPFPWITWNARPYASEFELLNVPASSPDRLLFEFNSPATPVSYGPTAAPTVLPSPPANLAPYGPTTGGASTNLNARGPFGHLLNFFDSSDSTFAAGQAPNFYRVLEYLQVPSRFIGCETYLNPSVFKADGSGGAPTAYFLPPFNYVSNYRDPGRMNLNTITDGNVFGALMNGMVSPTFNQLCDSRRADTASTGAVINPATTLPTYFANPFRSAAGADLVPLQNMMHRGINATVLRAGTSTPDSGITPLFAGNQSQAPYNNANQNSYFAYQGLERVSNLVTTRSNVFGVWLTIGYFEAVPWGSVDAGHPDGYQLGEEIGSDTGEVERHRAFYIFDRSIPVGYERGQNHNVNRAILLKRYIE
jgi:hypothetical protein